MTGRFIAVVGPSGVGKDSFMRAMAAAMPRIRLARRVITRDAEALGEDFEGISVSEFKERKNAGEFVLWWPAHGLYYGIPKEATAPLASGTDVMANLSRGVLLQARDSFPDMRVIALHAGREILRKRLLERGREGAEEVATRLDRAGYDLPPGITAIELDNSGLLRDTVRKAFDLLYPVEATDVAG